jgi:hypothetical protein
MGGPVPQHEPTLGPCWLWTGAIRDDGYGLFRVDSQQVALAHRWAYERCYGEIPEGLHVDHDCHDPQDCTGSAGCVHRRCVNPAHLRARTPAENNERSGSPTAVNARKTHCSAGHPLDDANTYIHPRRGSRHCRTCQATRAAAWQARQAAAITQARAAHPPGYRQDSLI